MQPIDKLLYITCQPADFWSSVGIPADSESFMEAAGITSGFSVVNAQSGELPDPSALTGTVVIGGASGNLYDPEPWMDKLAAFTRALLDRGQANIFGICFGHQIVVMALGGTIAKSPSGRELGAYAVELTPAGRRHPLFKGVDDRFMIGHSHSDAVAQLPTLRQAEVLAANDNSIQALAIQSPACVATVQFHPDLSANSIAALASSRRKILISEGLAADDEDAQRFIARITEQAPRVEDARRAIIRNFMTMTKGNS